MESESGKPAYGTSTFQDPLESRERMEKIRDLLFGAHMRKLETMLTRLEERLLREIGEVRDGLRKQIDSLETYMKNELQTISNRVSAEQERRSEAIGEITSNIRQQAENFDKKTGQLENGIEQYAKDLREQILNVTRSLTDHVQHKHEEALRLMKEADDQIRADYVDRANLSRMFTQVAVRLDTALTDGIFSATEETPDE